MAKLFKTISLEDRLRGSSYNELPHAPNPVNQGSIDLKQVDKGEKLPTAQLKLTPRRDEANSQILKLTLVDRLTKSIEPLKVMSTKPISQIARPFVNTKFRSAISLENRLKQTTLGSTAHLPQFFLSDIFTDYITIKPFGVFNHTSNIVLTQPTTLINQGSVTLKNLEFDSLIAQGTTFSNGSYTSFTHIVTPTYDSLLLQGTVFSNSVYKSLVTITNSKPVGAIFQGFGTVPTIAISTPIISALQGPGTNPTAAVSVATVSALQGSTTISSLSAPAGSLTGPSPVIVTLPVSIPIVVPSSIVITNVTSTPNQGGADIAPYIFEPNRTSPILKVLRYAADRALAFFTPRIKHGSASLPTTSFQTSPFDPGNFYTNPIRTQAIGVLKAKLTEEQGSSAETAIDDSLKTYISNLVRDTGTKKVHKYDNVGKTIVSDDKYIKALGANAKDNIDTALATKNPSPLIDPFHPQIAISSTEGDKLATDQPLSVIDNYKTLTYGEIQTRVGSRRDGTGARDFREDLKLPKISYIGGKTPSEYIASKGDVEKRSPLSANTDSDFIDLIVGSKRNNTSVKFKAFITSFSDSFNMSWNDINYVGRQDTLKSFKGVTRGGSIGFKVAALTEADMAINFTKLNNLVKIAAMGSSGGDANYVQGPMCSITVGRWFKNTPCIFNSIKYDVQTAEYSWDIDKQMPHLVDVSLDFVVLGDTSGKPLNASSNNYFNYISK